MGKMIEITYQLPWDFSEEFMMPLHVTGSLEIKSVKIKHRFVKTRHSMNIDSKIINKEIEMALKLNSAVISNLSISDGE